MDKPIMYPINYAAAGAVMELGYRLTAAEAIIAQQLESRAWLDRWHSCIRQAMISLVASTNPEKPGDPRKEISTLELMQVNELLQPDPSTWAPAYFQSIPDVYCKAGRKLCLALNDSGDISRKADDGSNEVNNSIVDFFLLGEALAVDDLLTFAGYEVKVNPRFAALHLHKQADVDVQDEQSEFCQQDAIRRLHPCSGYPGFWDVVDKFMLDRRRYVYTSSSFRPSGFLQLLISVVVPNNSCSTVWILPNVDKCKAAILFSGPAFANSGVISLVNKLDMHLVDLLEIMDNDKRNEVRPEDCGWINRYKLLGTKNRDTAQKAWRVLEELSESMGPAKYVTINRTGRVGGKDSPNRGNCRITPRLADGDCHIFFMKEKT